MPTNPYDEAGNNRRGQFRDSDKTGTGFISGRTFKRKQVTYSVFGNMAIFEGDIALGTVEELEASLREDHHEEGLVPLGIGIKGERYRWPGGVVPWEADDALRPLMELVIPKFEGVPVRFVERKPGGIQYLNYISLTSKEPSGGCWSYVGMIGERQIISLDTARGCNIIPVALHEIGHALGLWHEQSRADRDTYVTIDWDNIIAGNRAAFEQRITDGDDIGSYDFESLMHYDSFAFARDRSKPTITKINGDHIPYNERLSPGDIATLNTLYQTIPITPWQGLYHTWIRSGGERGVWQGYHALKITSNGEVILGPDGGGEVHLYGYLFKLDNLYSFPPEVRNPEYSGQIQLKDGDQDRYFWGSDIIQGKCFKGGIFYAPGGGGPVDFRGRVILGG